MYSVRASLEFMGFVIEVFTGVGELLQVECRAGLETPLEVVEDMPITSKYSSSFIGHQSLPFIPGPEEEKVDDWSVFPYGDERYGSFLAVENRASVVVAIELFADE
mmetsp:Transcript_3163/g.5476  ORF Transcript_3163/g.5476 Transcript_3163/m.5476 type:complete len:106 (-) Transcript_3163:1135-1452(-)